MGQSVLAPIVLTFGVYFLSHGPIRLCMASSGGSSLERNVGISGLAQRRPILPNDFNLQRSFHLRNHAPSLVEPIQSNLPNDLIIVEEAEEDLVNKRQLSDDYGHMRFGKRGEAEEKFDDYGHMRFGRSRL